MIRNPFTRIRQETIRIAQRSARDAISQSRASASSAGMETVGVIDAATGTLTPYGQLDFTGLDDDAGFVLR